MAQHGSPNFNIAGAPQPFSVGGSDILNFNPSSGGSLNTVGPIDFSFGKANDNQFFNTELGSGGVLPDLNEGAEPGTFAKLFGKDGPVVPGLEAFGKLFAAFNAHEQVGLNKDAFAFNKGLKETNLANNAQLTNSQISDQARTVGRATGLTGDALEKYVSNQSAQRAVSGTI